jgi:hypothetical protein
VLVGAESDIGLYEAGASVRRCQPRANLQSERRHLAPLISRHFQRSRRLQFVLLALIV